MCALPGGGIEPAYHRALRVLDHDFHGGRLLATLGFDHIPPGERHRFIGLDCLCLPRLARILQCLVTIPEVICQHGAVGRVVGHIQLISLGPASGRAQHRPFEIPLCRTRLE